MKVRDNRVDIVKSIGIILVALGHTQMALCSFVNLFHVGLFFIASGFCFQEKYTDSFKNVKQFFSKRIKRLYIPFVLWNLGYLCFRNLFCAVGIYSSKSLSVRELIYQARDIVLMSSGEQMAGACWFIRALFIMEVLFVLVDYCLKKVCEKKVRLLRLLFVIVTLTVGAWLNSANIILPYNLSTVFSACILFVFGIEFRRLISRESVENEPEYLPIIKFFVGLGVLVVLLQFGTISYDSNNYPNVAFFIIAAVAGWAMSWGFAEIIEKYVPILCGCLTYVGKRTMDILFLHLLSFKIITLVIIEKNALSYDSLSAFPVLDNKWWALYLLCGVGVPLLVNAVVERCHKLFDKKRKIICLSIVVLSMVLVPNLIAKGIEQNSKKEILNLDWSLVYDKDEYMLLNRDVAESIGDDEDALLEHFIEYGIQEGRIASENFDVWYYRDNNGDLGEMYGENLEEYYIHYIQYGHAEGRKGSDSYVEEYDYSLVAKVSDDLEVTLKLEVGDKEVEKTEGYIFSMPAYMYEMEGLEPIYTGNLEDDLVVDMTLEDINNKYVAMVKQGEGYRAVSNYAYIQNPEHCNTNSVKMPSPRSKKGLQITNAWIEDVELLNPSHIFMNLVVEDTMYPSEVKDNVICYEYKGKTYYFKEDKITEYDSLISRLTKDDVYSKTSE